jgi:hypothetical protein
LHTALKWGGRGLSMAGVIFFGVRATKWALVGVSLLSAADVAAFDFF